MLSTFGRAAVQRLPLRTITTSPVVPRLASRAAATQPGLVAVLVSNVPSSGALRSFATKAEGTKDAKKPAKKTTTKASTRPKKAAAKPKKAAAKPKPKPKKKAVEKKKKAAPKPPTPEQKERLALRKEKLEKQQLKVASLYAEEPKNALPSSGYRVHVVEVLQAPDVKNLDAQERFAKAAASWKSLTSSELSRLNQIAEENKLKNQASHTAWVESHTPEEIQKANFARHTLKRKFNYPKVAQKHIIKDERLPTRVKTPFNFFTKARWASGDLANTPVTEAAARLAAEWKNLSESEKAPYNELYAADKVRFERESPVSK